GFLIRKPKTVEAETRMQDRNPRNDPGMPGSIYHLRCTEATVRHNEKNNQEELTSSSLNPPESLPYYRLVWETQLFPLNVLPKQ
ncbi:12779_t:CDS:2, partial [Dentiscutata erythropus]